MNKSLVLNTLHRLLSRSVTLLVLAGYGIYVLINALMRNGGLQTDSRSTAQAAWVLTWALGTGLLGSDRSDGYLPLLLSRPISRAQYVLSRWLGLVICVLSVDLALQLLVALFSAGGDTHLPGQMAAPFNPWAPVERWLWFSYFATLTAAWITLLSALFSGHGDLLYFFGSSLALLFLGARLGGQTVLSQVSEGLGWFWKPGEATLTAWTNLDKAGAAYTGLIFVAAAGVSLATAAYVMQRRDVSYVNR